MEANLIEDDNESRRDASAGAWPRRVRPRIEGTEELNITVSHSEVLRGIVDSLQFMPWDTRGRYMSLRLSSGRRRNVPSSHYRMHELVPVLLEELGSYELQKIDIECFLFALPAPAVTQLLRSGQQNLRHLSLVDVLISEVDESRMESLCNSIGQLANLESLTIHYLNGGNTTTATRGTPTPITFFLGLLRACREKALSSVSLNFSNVAVASLSDYATARRLFGFRNDRKVHFEHLFQFLELPNFASILETCRWKEVRIVGGSVGLELRQGESLLPIARALKQNRHVQKISLGVFSRLPRSREPVSLSEEVVQSMEDAIKANDVLREIEFVEGGLNNSNNILAIGTGPTVSFYLKLNQAGRRRLLGNSGNEEGDPTREEWINTIIAYRDDASVVYFFLSKNPSLL